MANRIESVTKEVVRALAEHFDRNAKSAKEIIEEFPNANRALRYPAISIFADAPTYEPFQPYILSQGTVLNAQADIKYVTGQYNFSIQIDLWERSKEQRHDFYEEVYKALNSQLPRSGLSLELEKYHGVWCHYSMTNLRFDDSEASAQRREWRATLELVANTKAVVEKAEYMITEAPEITLEISEDYVNQ